MRHFQPALTEIGERGSAVCVRSFDKEPTKLGELCQLFDRQRVITPRKSSERSCQASDQLIEEGFLLRQIPEAALEHDSDHQLILESIWMYLDS